MMVHTPLKPLRFQITLQRTLISKFVLALVPLMEAFNTLAGISMMLKFFQRPLAYQLAKGTGPLNRLVLVQVLAANLLLTD